MMKYKISVLLLVFAGAQVFISCSKDQPVRTPDNPTILQYIGKAPELSLLNAAIRRVPLDSAFSTGGPFTFFAPTDSAFQVAGLTLDKINQLDTAVLGGILRYHIARGRINGDELFGFFSEDLACLHPLYQPTIIKNYYGIFLNGAKVTRANIVAADGVVQELGRVVLPPTGDALQTIAAQPDLTYMTAFFNTMSTARSLLLNNQVTLLAINDSAWKKYGFATLDRFNQEDTNFLYQTFIGYCINKGPHFTPEFLGGFTLRAADVNSNNSVPIAIDGLHIQGQTATLARNDIRATNGVVDVVNQVFFPGN